MIVHHGIAFSGLDLSDPFNDTCELAVLSNVVVDCSCAGWCTFYDSEFWLKYHLFSLLSWYVQCWIS